MWKNVTYKRGQVICQEGEIGHSMFILLQGNADITINSFSDQAQNLGTLQEGSFFGEMSLLEGKPRSATIVALSDEVIVLEIAEENFPHAAAQCLFHYLPYPADTQQPSERHA